MKLKYQTQKNSRINYMFLGFTTDESGWWYYEDTNEWLNINQPNPLKLVTGCCSHQFCRTVKAFRRKLKNAPKGVKFILSGRWVGYDVIGYGSKIY